MSEPDARLGTDFLVPLVSPQAPPAHPPPLACPQDSRRAPASVAVDTVSPRGLASFSDSFVSLTGSLRPTHSRPRQVCLFIHSFIYSDNKHMWGAYCTCLELFVLFVDPELSKSIDSLPSQRLYSNRRESE